MNKQHPKVFISHASEDKERFVIDFATKLRENGVDAWVDQWEIKPGDSLVEKIFEDGIKNMDIFVIVLSKFSINKSWVIEELNASVVKKISKNIKIIPVVIDDNIEVPEALKSTVWQKISNLDNYELEFKNILGAIFNIDTKPPIGAKPSFALPDIQINNLAKIDSLIFKALGDIVFTTNEEFLSIESIKSLEKELNLSSEQINESLEILENHSYITLKHLLGPVYPRVQFTENGIITYAESFIENFQEIFFNVIHLIMNEEIKSNKEITNKLSCNPILIDALFKYFESMDYIKSTTCLSGNIDIHTITATGKRYFREVLENRRKEG